MDFHFGTPSRLERQIAQDLMQDQSELDLSLPGGAAAANGSMSTSTRHPLTSYTNNHASYSRASASSAGSFRDDPSFDISNNPGPLKEAQKPPPSLAAAVARSHNPQQSPVQAKENVQPRPGSSQSSSASSSAGPRAKHGSAPPVEEEPEHGIPPFSASSSISMDQNADNSRTHQFPDPYGHLRAPSPPLTSTPQRAGPASTVGSRSRTTMTIRQAHFGDAGGRSVSRSRGTAFDSTLGSTTQGAKSLRSASSALEDLTESSIASEDRDVDQDAAATDGADAVSSRRTPAAARDFVVYDTVSAAAPSETEEGSAADADADAEVQTGTMHLSEIDPQTQDGTTAPGVDVPESPRQPDPRDSPLAESSGSDWRRRREARRQLGDVNDESMIDDEEEDATRALAASHTDTQPTTAEAMGASGSTAQDDSSSMPPPPPSIDTSGQTGADVDGERSATTFSSPAAARLARQADRVVLGKSRLGRELDAGVTPSRVPPHEGSSRPGTGEDVDAGAVNGAATPRAQTSAADHEKMKAYLLNSVKATATIGSSRKDTRIRTLERLQAQAILSQTPARVPEETPQGDDETSPSSADAITPRHRMDRLGKANTFAAGRTPLPKGGIAELLRRGALSRLGDTSDRSGSMQSQVSPYAAYDGSSRGGQDNQTILESLAGLSEASSNDLTAPPQTSVHGPLGLRANTSFPGLGAAEVGTDANAAARPRVDPSRLAVYQSKLNARLDAENDELKRERDELSRQLEELRRQNGELRRGSTSESVSTDMKAAGSPLPGAQNNAAEDLLAERERANALDKEAQELADLLDEREREIETLHAELEQVRNGADSADAQGDRDPAGDERSGRSQASNDGETAQLRFEIEELQAQLKERDEDIMDLEDRLEDERKQFEQQVQQAKAYSFETLEKVEAARDEALDRADRLENELEESRQACDRLRAELDSQQARAEGRDSAETENVELRQQVSSLSRKAQQLEREVETARSESKEASDRASEHAERVQALERQVEAWKAEVADLEADLEEERHRAERADDELAALRAEEQDPDATAKRSDLTRSVGSQRSRSSADRRAASLERQLTSARETIEQLQSQIEGRASSPTSEADNVRAKDLEVQLLKKQKSELQLRVDEYRKMISAGVGSSLALLSQQQQEQDQEMARSGDKGSKLSPTTPGGRSPLPKSVLNLRHISPMKTPRSPAPLSEASWLYNESSLGGAGVAERIAFLESALDEANASIDAKLQKLDSAGVAHLTLAERLERANQRIAELEAELERLRMRASAAAGAAGSSSFSVSDSPNKSTRSAVQRQRVFADVHAQLEALKSRWASDHDQLKTREAEVERREHELADRSRERREYRGVLAELDRFRTAAASLQDDLHAEQVRQREMLAKSKATSQEKADIETRLMSTQSELDAVKRKLQDKMGGLESLSRQLFDKSTRSDGSDPRSRSGMQAQVDALSQQVESAQAQVEELRQERHDLLSQRADLHAKFAKVNERYESVAADLAVSRQALAAHQAQLDEQIEQMEATHAALRSKRAEYAEVVGDRDRLRAERDDIVRDVGRFESELRRVRREADRQGSDLEALRAERERAQRKREKDDEDKERQRARDLQQVQELVRQLKLKTKEVEDVKAKLEEADRIRSAAPPPYVSSSHQAAVAQQHLLELRAQHAQECKGLMLQIRYLKAKLTRESDLRSDLAHQKTYITLLLRGLVEVDDEIDSLLLHLRIEGDERRRQRDDMVARFNPARRRWNVAIKAVRAGVRMRMMATKWQKACEMKNSLADAHQAVRQRRKDEAEAMARKGAGEGDKHGHLAAPRARRAPASQPSATTRP
ncbi:uncharacterized protein PFL1_02557 [Pseudozyma flocculosa PF-1]|uniref:Related to Cingulin n=2 Tax=Pseudozyma flocculosa TaxID=84751 RepID=A0A5C3EZY7_9BASI|nr:uncharacterized protein PFL1_02557 [Pseudozyma flocculosa PF-1]EPQ29884.1 hypothetical protein PFL1_02557 [Pseudozyma flocculosa PF-1]SPO37186.1 related to Cingulin [Pseudozyma flocculosa]